MPMASLRLPRCRKLRASVLHCLVDAPHSRLPLTMRRWPLWLRWALTLLGFGTLAIIAVAELGGSGNPSSSQRDAAALVQANRAARLVVIQDQAPHSSPLSPSVDPQLALERAIAEDAHGRVRRDELGGPVKEVRCAPVRQTQAARRPFKCTARVGSIDYPYLGVADLRAQRLTWCKMDPAPSVQVVVPVSPRCSR